MFKGTESHGLVSIQFFIGSELIFNRDVQLSKDTITELYKNLSFDTLSGKRQADFGKISELTSHNWKGYSMKYEIVEDVLKDQPYEHKKG